MSRQVDTQVKLSDDDRKYLLGRNQIDVVAANDAQFRSDEGLSVDNRVQRTGLTGDEPSLQSDRHEGAGQGAAQMQVRVDPTAGSVQEPEEEDEYDEMSGDELREELRGRGLTVGGKVAELRQRLRQDDVDNPQEEDEG